MMRPVIAIVGRPNVGKSTLFNRMVGRRQAIVNDTAGVTRDRHYGKAEWCGREFILIDTGGIADDDAKSIQNFIKKQTIAAISEAGAVICLLDGREGPTPLDASIIHMLRKTGKPVFYAVNKLEEPVGRRYGIKKEPSEFHELGIKGRLYSVSAEHGIGVDDLLDDIMAKMGETETGKDRTTENAGQARSYCDSPTIAVIGRPNAGKSTLINRLAGTERVIAHELAGTTRDSIDVEITYGGRRYIFVDTAGLKRKGKTLETLDKFSAVKSLSAIDRAKMVLLIVDSNEGFTHQDASLLEYAYSEGKGVLVLFNKWDIVKAPPKELKKFYEEKLLRLRRVPFLCISARTGLNIGRLFEEIEKLDGRMEKRLSTSELNRALEDIKAQHNIPAYKGRAVKLFYATQVKSAPPSFLIFSNHPEGVGEGYRRYIVNRLQEMIGDGVPIRIKLRKK